MKPKLPANRITYSLQELARATGLSLRTLQREVGDGALAAIKIRGGRVMATAEAAEKWLASRERVK